MSIAENIEIIEDRILKACTLAGRNRSEITLMGVSKFVPIPKIKEAVVCGIKCFGESKVQEAVQKFESFDRTGIELHMIGSLQRNKAKTALQFFDCIQSVDREQLITELAKSVLLKNEPLKVLLEFHTGEESKSGFENIEALFRGAESVVSLGMKPVGLMTMAPYTKDVSLIRASFRKLVYAQKELKNKFPGTGNWECLSMGMSNDFDIAVEEGSTMLRIGSLIFKE